MKSRFQLAGHPIHVMVVGIPIGLYAATLLADTTFVMTKDPFWFRMAFWCIAVGLVGNVGAVATGLPDFLAIKREAPAAWNAATTHLAVGAGMLVLYGVNFVLHNWGSPLEGGETILPFILSLVGALLLGLQGWYGGELVFRHRIGVEGSLVSEATEGRSKRKGAH